ncbi:hypothetical protein SLS53_008907 [Cytospora paraplurivora]|uniref:Xylanolytic transcriptional activator regulatory domain-containing protein n=1 Tax=Cytospora paraplurivora TaxID=2898453 RepID=A0AAN9U4Z8_9PEZI
MRIALLALIRSDLDSLYFDRIHKFIPIIHEKCYYQRTRPYSELISHTCLQYAMWTLASALSFQFHDLRDDLYRETLHMLGNTEPMSPGNAAAPQLEVAQAWILISIYDFTQVTFHSGWASVGRAIRLIQLMRLNNVDASAHTDEPRDFIECETKRRTFWVAFCLDRFTSILEELPLALNEQTICTRLPSPEKYV